MSSLATPAPGETLAVARGQAVVCVPVFGAVELFARALESVLAHSPAGTPIVVADDATPGDEVEAVVRRTAAAAGDDARVAYVRRSDNVGFVRNVNAVLAAAAPGDVVIVNSDVEVAAGWFERLRAAALADPLVATASVLANNGTILSVPERDAPNPGFPGGLDLAEAAARVAAASLRLRPRVPTAVGHCLYVRRSALELVGDFDERFSPGYGEEVDFSQRCIARGLHHVVADDVLVLHHGGASFGGASGTRQELHERELNRRYPYYPSAGREASRSEAIPLARSLAAGRVALCGLSVTVDGSCLGPQMTGTQVHTLELCAALARRGDVRLRVTVPPSIGPQASAALQELGVETMLHPEISEATRTDDVVHRPFQVTTPRDFVLLRRLGRRVVLTQQDLIAYHTPGYFPDVDDWRGYRELTRQALDFADRVSFFSQAAAHEALGEDLVEPERTRVVHIGVDHRALPPVTAARRPGSAYRLEDQPFLLCLGADFRHKNRVFALEVLEALRRDHGFDGRLVLAGPRAASGGSSAPDESAWLLSHPAVAAAVVELGPVAEEEKAWLYEHAALVLYPTVKEGFGLVPFEAADAGAACLWPAHSSLAEVLPPEAAGVVMWDAAATASRAAELLADRGEREALVQVVRGAGARWSWDAFADGMTAVYREAATSAVRTASDPQDALSELAIALVGPRGWVPPEVQQALFAIATRPRLRRGVFGGLRGGYRAAYRARRLGRPD